MIELKYSIMKRQMLCMLSGTLLGISHSILQKSFEENELWKMYIEKREDLHHTKEISDCNFIY